MKPASRKDHNVVYFGPSASIGDLSCRRIKPGQIRSHWKPSEDELAVLVAGGHVEIDVFAEPIPPLSVNVETAEDELAPDEISACPFCTCQVSKPGPVAAAEPGTELRICDGCGKLYPRGKAAK